MNHTFTFYCLWALSVVKLCRPLGACHAVKIKIHLHVHSYMLLLLRKYASTYIHSFPSPDSPKIILLLSRRESPKTLSYPCYSPWNKCSRYFGYYHLLHYSRRVSALKKYIYEEIKRGKCPEPRRKRKSETRDKNGQVSDSRIRGTRYPPEKKISSISFPSKSFKVQERYVSPQKSKSRIRLSSLSPLSPYTIHPPHMHILVWLIDLFLWIRGLAMQ